MPFAFGYTEKPKINLAGVDSIRPISLFEIEPLGLVDMNYIFCFIIDFLLCMFGGMYPLCDVDFFLA